MWRNRYKGDIIPISREEFDKMDEDLVACEEKCESDESREEFRIDLDGADIHDRSKRRCRKPGDTYTGWLYFNGKFIPNRDIINTIKSGVYEIKYDCNLGHYLTRVRLNDEPLTHDNTQMAEISEYVKTFWDSSDKFIEHGIGHKRGVLMYGLPGTGKSCIIRAVALDTVARDGIVILIRTGKDNSSLNSIRTTIASIRRTEPSRIILICIEDIEYFVEDSESSLINLIDGADSVGNVVYIATTNFIKRLPKRLTRPSRFDNIVEIKPPNKAERKAYLKFLSRNNGTTIGKRWYDDTKDMTYAELKELFIAVNVFGKKFNEVRKSFKVEYGNEVA